MCRSGSQGATISGSSSLYMEHFLFFLVRCPAFKHTTNSSSFELDAGKANNTITLFTIQGNVSALLDGEGRGLCNVADAARGLCTFISAVMCELT